MWSWTLVLLQLLHSVQSAAGTEPLDLGLIEGVVQEDGLLGPVGVLDDAFQGLQGVGGGERLLGTWSRRWGPLRVKVRPAGKPSSSPGLGMGGRNKTRMA